MWEAAQDAMQTQPFASQRRYICVMDVLGFASIVQGSDLARLVYQAHTAGMLAEIAAGIGSRLQRQDGSRVRVHMQRFSDTVLLFTDRAEPDDLQALVEATSSMLSGQALNGFLLRGAILKGDLYVHRDLDVVVGAGLVEAYEHECRQNWGGVLLVEDGMDDPLEKATISYLRDEGWLMEWSVPMKGSGSERHLAVGWSFWLKSGGDVLAEQVARTTPAQAECHRAMQDATWEFYRVHRERFPRRPGPTRDEMSPEERERLASLENLIAAESARDQRTMSETGMSPVELYFLDRHPNCTALTGRLPEPEPASGGFDA